MSAGELLLRCAAALVEAFPDRGVAMAIALERRLEGAMRTPDEDRAHADLRRALHAHDGAPDEIETALEVALRRPPPTAEQLRAAFDRMRRATRPADLLAGWARLLRQTRGGAEDARALVGGMFATMLALAPDDAMPAELQDAFALLSRLHGEDVADSSVAHQVRTLELLRQRRPEALFALKLERGDAIAVVGGDRDARVAAARIAGGSSRAFGVPVTPIDPPARIARIAPRVWMFGEASTIAGLDRADREALLAGLRAGSKLVVGADSPRTILAIAADARLHPALRDLLLAEAHVI